jgi:hypothetical protein
VGAAIKKEEKHYNVQFGLLVLFGYPLVGNEEMAGEAKGERQNNLEYDRRYGESGSKFPAVAVTSCKGHQHCRAKCGAVGEKAHESEEPTQPVTEWAV